MILVLIGLSINIKKLNKCHFNAAMKMKLVTTFMHSMLIIDFIVPPHACHGCIVLGVATSFVA